MEAKDLRIGNYVVYSDDNRLFEVIEIDKTGITVIDNEKDENIWIDLDCFEPIPLTEEWLLKFGFNKKEWWKNGNKTYTKGSIQIDDFKISRYSFDFGYYSDHVSIQFVHQLQNLYFALTEEELTIKNKP